MHRARYPCICIIPRGPVAPSITPGSGCVSLGQSGEILSRTDLWCMFETVAALCPLSGVSSSGGPGGSEPGRRDAADAAGGRAG